MCVIVWLIVSSVTSGTEYGGSPSAKTAPIRLLPRTRSVLWVIGALSHSRTNTATVCVSIVCSVCCVCFSRNDIMLLKWDMPGNYVEVAGKFINPAWKARLPLFKCLR